MTRSMVRVILYVPDWGGGLLWFVVNKLAVIKIQELTF